MNFSFFIWHVLKKMNYKSTSNKKISYEVEEKTPTIPLDSILERLLLSYSNYNIKDIFASISELNRYVHEFIFDVSILNCNQINGIFYTILLDDNFSPIYDNVIRSLKKLISIPGFDITPFENVQFFQRIIFNIAASLRNPSERLLLLASILDISRIPRSGCLNSDIMSHLFENSLTDESSKSATFSFFASACILLDDFLENYILDITSFFLTVLVEKVNNAKLFYDYLEILMCRIPHDYISQCLADFIDFTDLLEQCGNKDELDQISTLKIILRLLEIENQTIKQQVDLHHFAYIFDKESSTEEEENLDQMNEAVLILFFKIISKIIKYSYSKQSFGVYIDKLIQFSIYCIDQVDFKVKKASMRFLTELIPLSPVVLPTLLQMNYISILSQYLGCSGNKIKSVVLKSLLYILHTLGPNDEVPAFTLMEEEEIARKVNEIEINEKTMKTEIGDLDIQNMILEFNHFYDVLTKKIHIFYGE